MSMFYSRYVSVGFFVMLCAVLPSAANALSALEEWNNVSRDALPIPVKVWLGLMMLNNISALFFLKNHVAARWVFAGFVVSHGIVMLMWSQSIVVMAGLVALLHIIFWTPGIIAIWYRRSEMLGLTPYRFWSTFVLIFYSGSMFFDVPDAVNYIIHLLG